VKKKLIDTNVIIRFLVEDPQKISAKFKGVFSFFPKVEKGEVTVHLPDLVLFEAYYVLNVTYNIPREEVAEKLYDLVSFKGILMHDKQLILDCLTILKGKNIDLVDAYIPFSGQILISAILSNSC